MELNKLIIKYLDLKRELIELLSNLEVDSKLSENIDINILYELMKDNTFECNVFEIMLHIDSALATDYINKFYLAGDPEKKTRFKGNIDVMLDDYKEILGKDMFLKLIDVLPLSTKEFPPIREAIDSVKDD
ncbi:MULTISPECIES: hypothetical protein [Myroides]|uniref:Uncharacterized protein n=1 Tax=Myroides albus TaxID=2562892 RepID=A0A6I3LQB3_9FLAO|nr:MULTISPECIES: hypothetical protein [Myroides]MTG99520.1 hypothetical protein [Myroides albus]MVX35743.1 hypothetical protein [Myroides sp. LoEW2-1]UVD80386.1 hypothetical protein NWE55_03700 [Myroides albus]